MLCGCSWGTLLYLCDGGAVAAWCQAAALANLDRLSPLLLSRQQRSVRHREGISGSLLRQLRVWAPSCSMSMRNPGSSEAFDVSYVPALLFSGSRAGRSSCAHLGCGSCTWTLEVAFYKFEMLAACFTFVATVSGRMSPFGGNCFQFMDAMLAAMLVSGLVLESFVSHFVAVANLTILQWEASCWTVFAKVH